MKKLTRKFYPYWDWECFHAGMYETTKEGVHPDTAKEIYREFLSDLGRFESAITRVFSEWPKSCEQFLTNPSINKIAWVGQASLCIATGLPAVFRGGFKLLTPEQQTAANEMASKHIKQWEAGHVGN